MHRLTLQNSNSKMCLNLNMGGQIESLILKHPSSSEQIPVILSYDEKENFFLSGNFLMYPWVNRLESNAIQISNKSIAIEPIEKDPNNHPIHGLYFNKGREVVELKRNSAKIKPIQVNKNFPSLTENFILKECSLTIRTEFYNETSDIQEFAYGYHPYLTLNTNIDDCLIFTNLTDYIPLTSDYLPNPSLEKRNLSELFSKENPIGKLQLDHLLTVNKKDSFFGIYDPKQNITLQVRVSENSQLPLPYFQIYTPENRNTIAIEPMTSTGNAFFIQNSGLCKLLPGESLFGEFLIELA